MTQSHIPPRDTPSSDAENPAVIADDSQTLFLNINLVDDQTFASIRMRGIGNAIPSKMVDNGGYPDRTLMFWPVPTDSTKAVELWVWEPLDIKTLDEELNLPRGYERYYIYSLAKELAAIFGNPLTQEIVDNLAEAENEIKTINQIDFTVRPTLSARELCLGGAPYNYIDFITGAIMLPPGDGQ